MGIGAAGIAVGAGVNVIHADTAAFVGNNAVVNAVTLGASLDQSVQVAAGNDFYHTAIAGSVAGGVAAVAPSVGVSVLNNDTSATIGDDAMVNARNDVAVRAHQMEDILLVGFGIAGGVVAVGGSVEVLRINHTTLAGIGSATVDAGGDVLVLASDHTDSDLISGTVSGGLVGVGGSVGVMSIEKDTTATIDSNATIDADGLGAGIDGVLDGTKVGDGDSFGRINASGVIVQAESSEEYLHFVLAASGGYVGVAGGVAVTLFDSDTTASIGAGAMINQTGGNAGADASQSVHVNAANELRGFSFAGGIAGGVVAFGGAVDVGIVRNDTLAEVGDGTVITARDDAEVNALGIKDLDGLTFSSSGGGVAFDAAVSVWSIGEALEKDYTDNDGNSANATEAGGDSADAGATAEAETGTNETTSALDSFDDDGGNPNNSNTKQVGNITGMAASRIDADSPDASDFDSIINAAGTPSGTTANVAASATINAGNDIAVTALEGLEFDPNIGGLTTGAIGTGGSVSVVNTSANTSALANGTFNAPNGDVTVVSQLDEEVSVRALRGEGGIFTVGASVVVVNDTSDVQASLGSVENADQVMVLADANQEMDVDSNRFAMALGATGASFTRIDTSGEVAAVVNSNAQIGQAGNVNDLDVRADALHHTQAETNAFAGGGVAVNANFAIVDASPDIEASIGNSADIDVAGSIDVRADADVDVDADVLALTGGLSATGASIAIANLDADVQSLVRDNATLSAGDDIFVRALKNHDGTDAIPNRGATAIAEAASISAAGSGTGTIATAHESSLVRSRVGANSELTSGNGASNSIFVLALNSEDAQARGLGLSISVLPGVGIGGTIVDAHVTGTSEATLFGDASGGGGLRVEAESLTRADADGDAASGSLGGSGTGAGTTAYVSPTISAMIGNGTDPNTVDMSQSVTVRADHEGDADAASFGVSVGAVAVGVMIADATMAPDLDAVVNDFADVNAGAAIVLESRHNQAGQLITASADAAGGGIAVGTGVEVSALSQADLNTRVLPRGIVDAGTSIRMESTATNLVDAIGEAFTIGGVTVGVIVADGMARGSTKSSMNGIARSNSGLTVESIVEEAANVYTEATTGGLLGSGAASVANATVGNPNSASDGTSASIGANATVDVGGAVSILAISTGDATSESEGVSFGGAAQFGVGLASSTIDSQVAATVGDNASIEADSLGVVARHNTDAVGNPNGQDAVATSWAAGGSLGLGLNFVEAPVTSSADVSAVVGDNASVRTPGGNVRLNAFSSNRATSSPQAETISFGAAFGLTRAEATTDGSTIAQFGGDIQGPGGTPAASDLRVEASDESRAAAATRAASQAVVVAAQGTTATANVHPTVQAGLTGAADVHLTDDFVVAAHSETNADAEARGFSAAIAAIGGSVADANVTPHVDAFVGAGADLQGDGLFVEAFHNSGLQENGAVARASASGGGVISGTGAFASADMILDVDAHVDGDAIIRNDFVVTADSNNLAESSAGGTNISGLGVGVSESTANVSGSQFAYLGDIEATAGQHIRINNVAANDATADSQSLSGGILGDVSLNFSIANIDPFVRTSIEDGASVAGGDEVRVRGQVTGNAAAVTSGAQVAGLAAIGTSQADAFLDSNVESYIGAADVTANNVIVRAYHNTGEGGSTSDMASAETHASSGAGVFSANGSIAAASSTAEVSARLGGNGSSIHGGERVEVVAGSINDADALADGIVIAGVFGGGIVTSTTTANGDTTATVDNNTSITGGDLSVLAEAGDFATSETEAAAGGLVAAADGSVATTTTNPDVLADVQSGVQVDVLGNVAINARSRTEGDANAQGVSLAGGVSGGTSLARVNVLADVDTDIDADARIQAGGYIQIRARHNDKVNIYDGTFDTDDVSVANDTISTQGGQNHGLSTGDRVTYRDQDETPVGGLSDGQSYEAIVVDATTVRLGQTFLGGDILPASDTITFNNAHGFTTGQRLFYGNTENAPAGGLALGQDYYVFVIDEFTIKLYDSQAEAIAPGESFSAQASVDSAAEEITIAGHIFVQDQAVTYIAPASTAFAGSAIEESGGDDNIITFGEGSVGSDGGGLPFDHGFQDGDRVTYRAESTVAGGLVNGGDYYVLRLNANELQLATDPNDLAGTVVDVSNPDQPDENSLHFLSDYQQVPLHGLDDGATYYVDVVDPNTIRLQDSPGGNVINISNVNIQGVHSIRAAGMELSGGNAGQHFLYVDLTSSGSGIQRLVGAGGAVGLIGSGDSDGVFSAATSGSAGSLFGSFRFVDSTFDIDANVSTNIDDGAILNAVGDIDVVSSSFLNAAGVARVAAGALVGIGSATVNTNFDHQINSRIGEGTELTTESNINIDSISDHEATANTKAIGGGGIAAADADSAVDILHETDIDVEEQSSMSADGNVEMLARARFGGNLTNDADSGGFAIRPDADANYNVGDGERQDTRIDIGIDATIFSKRDVSIFAEVDNDGRIDARSYANAYGVLADTNADANIRIRSDALVNIAPRAEITGWDSLTVTAVNQPLSVFTLADADGKALSDSDAFVRFVADTGSQVLGMAAATLTSHDVDVSALIGENSFGFRWSYRGAWPVSDGDNDYDWTTDQEILFDSDVVLLPGPQPELVIDASREVVTARNVTVNGGFGEGYIVPGNDVFVDDIINNDPGRANFETNDLGGDRPGIITDFAGVPGIGTITVQHTFEEVTILNDSDVNLVIRNINPIDRDGIPRPEVSISTVDIDYEFNIEHSFQSTLITIENFQSGNNFIPAIYLTQVIDNPIGTTSITNHAGSISHFSPTFEQDYLIRSNIVNLDASEDVGGVGEFQNITFINPIRVDLVQSENRPEDLTAVAGRDVSLELRGVLREEGVNHFEVNISFVSAGRNVDIQALKSISELEIDGVGDYALTVDTDLYTSDPPADEFVRYFRPDMAGPPMLVEPILGVFGSNAVEIPSTYVFDLIEYSQFFSIFTLGGDDCTSLDVTAVDTTPGGGGVDWLAGGDITANFPNGDGAIGSLVSQFGNVTVKARGDIYDADGQNTVDIVGNNITLNSTSGSVGIERNGLEIDSAFSGPGGIGGSAAGGVYLTELAGPLRINELSSGIGVIQINALDGLLGDFDRDDDLDVTDVNRLVAQIVAGQHDPLFDTTGDGLVTRDDLNDWIVNLKKTLIGDANLDFVVDVSDFNRWNTNKFTANSSWSNGDFNADGFVDVSDFNLWNLNKFTSADGLSRDLDTASKTSKPIAVGPDDSDTKSQKTVGNQNWVNLVEAIFADKDEADPIVKGVVARPSRGVDAVERSRR